MVGHYDEAYAFDEAMMHDRQLEEGFADDDNEVIELDFVMIYQRDFPLPHTEEEHIAWMGGLMHFLELAEEDTPFHAAIRTKVGNQEPTYFGDAEVIEAWMED